MFKEYGELSTQLYEITKPIGTSIAGDIEYYHKKIKDIKGKILEAGVGTGRMLIPLMEKGIDIDGVDLSPEMLAACQHNLNQRQLETNLYLQNLVNLSLPTLYHGIIMPTGSFCLLPKNLITEILASFFQHLETGGKLICDVELPLDFIPNQVSTSSYPLKDNQGLLFTSTSEEINWHEQKTAYIHRYDLLNKGAIEKTEVSNFVLYWYSQLELELLLKATGFSKVAFEVGYNQDTTSSLITFIATK